jgi:hypothetical protein
MGRRGNLGNRKTKSETRRKIERLTSFFEKDVYPHGERWENKKGEKE